MQLGACKRLKVKNLVYQAPILVCDIRIVLISLILCNVIEDGLKSKCITHLVEEKGQEVVSNIASKVGIFRQ